MERGTLMANPVSHTLPNLPYSYDALEPYIDARTMEIHHIKHHNAYIAKLNEVLACYPDLGSYSADDLLHHLDRLEVEEVDRTKIRNHAGGHLNHSFFWTIMGPGKEADQELLRQITQNFGSVGDFKSKFTEVAMNHFGSGWAWLVREPSGDLQMYSTDNQDSPLLQGHQPVIGLDVWEHAYYLKYQDRRKEYIENWWKVLKLI